MSNQKIEELILYYYYHENMNALEIERTLKIPSLTKEVIQNFVDNFEANAINSSKKSYLKVQIIVITCVLLFLIYKGVGLREILFFLGFILAYILLKYLFLDNSKIKPIN